MLKVLIVEDEVITANDIKETLEKAGHEVTLQRSHGRAQTSSG